MMVRTVLSTVLSWSLRVPASTPSLVRQGWKSCANRWRIEWRPAGALGKTQVLGPANLDPDSSDVLVESPSSVQESGFSWIVGIVRVIIVDSSHHPDSKSAILDSDDSKSTLGHQQINSPGKKQKPNTSLSQQSFMSSRTVDYHNYGVSRDLRKGDPWYSLNLTESASLSIKSPDFWLQKYLIPHWMIPRPRTNLPHQSRHPEEETGQCGPGAGCMSNHPGRHWHGCGMLWAVLVISHDHYHYMPSPLPNGEASEEARKWFPAIIHGC